MTIAICLAHIYSYVESRLKFAIVITLRQLTNRAFVWVEVIRKTPHVS